MQPMVQPMAGRRVVRAVRVAVLALVLALGSLLLAASPAPAPVSFSDPTYYYDVVETPEAGDAPISVAVVDPGPILAPEGPDLAVANRDSDELSVLLSAGGGSFSSGHFVGPFGGDVSEVGPQSLAVGDFNGDSDFDVAVALTSFTPDFPSGNVAVLLGRGPSSGSPGTTPPASSRAR